MDSPAPALNEAKITTNELAARLGVHPVTVKKWRVQGIGPRFVALTPSRIRYRESDLAVWLAERARTSTAPVPSAA